MDPAARVILAPAPGDGARRLIAYALRRGFGSFLLPMGSPPPSLPGARVHRWKGGVLVPAGPSPQGPTEGAVVHVHDPSDLPSLVARLGRSPVVLVVFEGDRILPLENLIAMRQRGTPGRLARPRGDLWVQARSPEELPGLLGALEHGADAVVVPVASPEEVDRVESFVDHPSSPLRWATAKVVRAGPGGTGERVAVDTTNLLAPEEGLLVGSHGAFLFHVRSEAEGSRFTAPRPFRVNAGAVHSYVLMADGSTKYLSELSPGDRVLVVSPRGAPRSVRVGRLKVERRPLTLVEAEQDGRLRTLFAQEAETVRLSGPSRALPVPELRPGNRLLGVTLPAARHFGMAVAESIQER